MESGIKLTGPVASSQDILLPLARSLNQEGIFDKNFAIIADSSKVAEMALSEWESGG